MKKIEIINDNHHHHVFVGNTDFWLDTQELLELYFKLGHVKLQTIKNIQTMEQKDINIYEILKGVEYGTELYTPMCGNVVFTFLPSNNEIIRTEKDLRIYRFDKNESEDTLTFGNQYEIENEKFVTDQTFDLRISVNKELREATELEVELFNKHYAIWKKEKEAKEQPAFKTFDKVLVRDGKEYEWLPALFVRDRGDGANYRYKVFSLRSGKPAEFACCIPYEGNENIIFTDRNIDNLPF